VAKPKIVLVGGGRHCKVVISVLNTLGTYDIAGICDVPDKLWTTILGAEIRFTDDQLEQLFNSGIKNAFVTKGSVKSSTERKELFEKLERIGFSLPSIVSGYAIVDESVRIGSGTLVMPGAIVNADSIIGENCILNTGCIVEHDCVIDDHSHIGISATLSGTVRVGECSLIGAGATVIQNLTIGKNVTVGAGSVVILDVSEATTVVGNPARIL